MNGIRQQLREWHKNIPNMFHGSFRKRWIKALQHKSMKAAVVAKRQDCMNWQNTEAKECNIVTCPLWQYRPFRDKNGEVEAEVIAAVTEIDRNEMFNAGTDSPQNQFPAQGRPLGATLGKELSLIAVIQQHI